MTVTDFQLYYGTIISLSELKTMNFLTPEMFGTNMSEDDKKEFNAWSYVDISDRDISYDFDLGIEKLVVNVLPHDYSENRFGSEYNYNDTYYIIGVQVPDESSMEELKEFSELYFKLVPDTLKGLGAKFYNVPDDCHCCT